MVGKRSQPDETVAHRLYCRAGTRTTTFFYKHADNRNEILASAPTRLPDQVAKAKAEALRKWGELRGDLSREDNTMRGLFRLYFAWQEALPASSTMRKADSTIQTNKWEQTPLLAFFGDMLPPAITATHIYDYIDARTAGGAPGSVAKEVALLSAVCKYGIRKGKLQTNPCGDIQIEKRPPSSRLVTWDEIELMTRCGRALGGTSHIQALAARAAWLAFKRPAEVLKVRRDQVTADGLLFHGNKRRRSQGEITILIEWSPELRATVEEAMGIKRWANFGGDRMVFGNLAGHAYTKSGWGTLWRKFMDACASLAKKEGKPFGRFTLKDCRPGGVTEKKRTGQEDVYEGTGHVDRRMVDGIYDRRKQRRSTPAK